MKTLKKEIIILILLELIYASIRIINIEYFEETEIYRIIETLEMGLLFGIIALIVYIYERVIILVKRGKVYDYKFKDT